MQITNTINKYILKLIFISILMIKNSCGKIWTEEDIYSEALCTTEFSLEWTLHHRLRLRLPGPMDTGLHKWYSESQRVLPCSLLVVLLSWFFQSQLPRYSYYLDSCLSIFLFSLQTYYYISSQSNPRTTYSQLPSHSWIWRQLASLMPGLQSSPQSGMLFTSGLAQGS